MKKISSKDAPQIPIGDIVGVINGGIQLVEATGPLLKTLWDKVADWVVTLGKSNPNSPKNVRLRLAAVEAQNKLQKEENKLLWAEINALKAKG